MRVCWNWQTGTFEVRVLYDIRVQVPSPAPLQIANAVWLEFFRELTSGVSGEFNSETVHTQVWRNWQTR